MRFKLIIMLLFLLLISKVKSQQSNMQKFKELSCPEKWWVIKHPFVAKKALKTAEKARVETEIIIKQKLLKGNGNGGQVDAFRHAFWMAILTQEIGWRRARNLGESHEKGNYKTYKKSQLEDGIIPDKISSEMDLFNNSVGIEIGRKKVVIDVKLLVINVVKEGRCKVVKKDAYDNFLDCDGKSISKESLKGKWENNKCLVNSDE
ncbi:MAG: hypothetical protein HRT73_07140 [Flavobacteriales bacterium]|nr:hypothetical protein [Flavobacteriales bacterium]